MEIADQRDVHALRGKPVADQRHGGGGFLIIYGDARQFRTGPRQFRHLRRRRRHIGGISAGHGLHHNGRIAAHGDGADLNSDAGTARKGSMGHGH